MSIRVPDPVREVDRAPPVPGKDDLRQAKAPGRARSPRLQAPASVREAPGLWPCNGLEAERVVESGNRYLSEMTEAILGRGGTLVSFMGDGIMALFGAPIEQADHATRAVGAARDMLSERLPRFNAWLREQGIEQEFRMGIGLNSGPVMSGNVGSAQRLEYTALGDTTNTAARLEGMTKGTEHQVYLAESTCELLEERPQDVAFVGEL